MLTLDALIGSLEDPAATLETLAQAEGVDLRATLDAVGLARTTFTRWKAGNGTRVGSVLQVARAIRQASAKAA